MRGIVHILAILPLLPACLAAMPRRPAATGPFAVLGPGPGAAAGLQGYWLFLGGIIAGILVAWLWRRLRLRRAQKGGGASWLPRELSLLRAALAILDELLATWQRQGVVVRMSEWLKKRK